MANLLSVMMTEAGHIIPALDLARVLKELGHNICFVTLEHFEGEIRRAGFDCASIRLSQPLECTGTNVLYGTLSAFSWRAAPLEDQRQYLFSVFEKLRTIKPDMVLVDRALDSICPFLEALHMRYLLVGTNFGDTVKPLVHSLKHDTEVLLCPRSIAATDDLKDKNRYFFDAPITRDRSRSSFPWEMIDSSKPLVYCSFGTQVELYPKAATIIREIIHYVPAAWSSQIVAVTGAKLLSEYRDYGLADVLLTVNAPQLDLMERADVLISHGGLGTIKEALHFAVPMFLIPFAHDQFANASRVVKAGYGRQLSSLEWSASGFRAEYDAFRDCLPQLRENLLQLRARSCLANGKLSLEGLGELVKSILQSPP